MNSFSYLAVICISYAFPFLFTLRHRRLTNSYGYSFLNVTVILTAIPFLVWDYVAHSLGHWYFSPEYITGFSIRNLPIEEFAFMIFIPQSTLLFWIALKRYSSGNRLSDDIMNHFRRSKHV